jgi:hypothetical protein
MLGDAYEFHVALYDLGEEGIFKWCRHLYSMPLGSDSQLKFLENQPDNKNNVENCIAINVLTAPNILMSDINCELNQQYICEVYTTYSSDIGKKFF